MENFNSKKYFEKLDRYFKLSTYLSVCELYLKDNINLDKKLKMTDIKDKLISHYGTVPGINFIYAHLNRIINKYDLNMILISGTGHGMAALAANKYLEDYKYGLTDRSLKEFCEDYYLFRSHGDPKSNQFHNGSELGYSLVHAYGAVLDNPNLIVPTIIGDGEAETGTLQASWFLHKFIDIRKDGIVLPIIHLNGFKLDGPSILSSLSNEELIKLYEGYGYEVHIVDIHEVKEYNELFAENLDNIIENLLKAKSIGKIDRFPLLILKSPKGWTGPKEYVNTNKIHRLPFNVSSGEELEQLEEWLRSYDILDLLKDNKISSEILELIPKQNKCLSNCFNQISVRKLILPDLNQLDNQPLCNYLNEITRLNNNSFIMFDPDELSANNLSALKENNRVMYSYLSEEICEGLLEGYTLTNRFGLLHSYESFTSVAISMINQHYKWLNMMKSTSNKVSSLNILLTNTIYEQCGNGYAHQDSIVVQSLISKSPEIINFLYPVDNNSLITTLNRSLSNRSKINIITAPRVFEKNILTLDESKNLLENGYFSFIESRSKKYVITIGEDPLLQTIKANDILQNLNVIIVNDLNILRDSLFYARFPRGSKIVIVFHGYRCIIKQIIPDLQLSISILGYEDKFNNSCHDDKQKLLELNRCSYKDIIRTFKK